MVSSEDSRLSVRPRNERTKIFGFAQGNKLVPDFFGRPALARSVPAPCSQTNAELTGHGSTGVAQRLLHEAANPRCGRVFFHDINR